MSTRVELKVEHLPARLRPLLAAYEEAVSAARDAQRAHSAAPVAEKGALKEAVDKTTADFQAAHTALLEGTREQPSQILDHNAARFASSVERAREHLEAAERELRAAAVHAAVHGAVRPGKPLANIERGAESLGRKRALFSVGQVREAIDGLPEDVD